MTASDNFNPNSQTGSATVTIPVTRDSPTVFSPSTQLVLTVSEEEPVNFTLTTFQKVVAVDNDLLVRAF